MSKQVITELNGLPIPDWIREDKLIEVFADPLFYLLQYVSEMVAEQLWGFNLCFASGKYFFKFLIAFPH